MNAVVVLVAVLVGVLVGAGTAALVLRRRAGDRRAPATTEATGAGTATAHSHTLAPGATDVLDALRGPTVVVDSDHRVVRASSMAHLLGLVRGERIAVPLLDSAVRQVRARGDHRAMELELDRGHSGGGVRTVVVEIVPLGRALVLVTGDDVTESRRLDAVRRDFVANVSHELKTPVGALSLLSEATSDAADDPEAIRRFAGRMQHESARLTELVNELIELSRLQDPGRPMDIEQIDVESVIDEAVDATRTSAQAKRIELERAPAVGVRLQGDRVQLVTAMRNLLANAITYSPEDTRIGIGVRVDDGLVEIGVSDQGIGIPLADQERVFERFYRVDPARSRETGGTGLGLSIVKHVAARHGGEVTLWSVEGSGSTFTLRLPLEARA